MLDPLARYRASEPLRRRDVYFPIPPLQFSLLLMACVNA